MQDVCDTETASLHSLDLESGSIAKSYKNIEGYNGAWGYRSKDSQSTAGILNKYISRRSISEVKTGICLSGGIDSNVIMCILSNTQNPPERCFTIKSSDPRYNETSLAINAASKYGTNHTLIDIHDDRITPLCNFIKLTKKGGVLFNNVLFCIKIYSQSCSAKKIKSYSGDQGEMKFFCIMITSTIE